MLPVGDDRKAAFAPSLTIALIALNAAAFFVAIAHPSMGSAQTFLQAWGVVPREFAARKDFIPTVPIPYWATVLTAMFLHGGWGHLGGNMFYLWIFGSGLERVMGRALFLLFYLVCGVVAALAHVYLNLGSIVPVIGASGAISGVLGAHLALFPRDRLRIVSEGGVVVVPLVLVLAGWIALQFVSDFGAVARARETVGIGYAAPLAGFLAGAAVARLLVAPPMAGTTARI